jgi:hypothetical protein
LPILELKDGIGGSYRLTSLDRLAARQRILEQNGGLGGFDKNGTDRPLNGSGGVGYTSVVRCDLISF